MEINLNSLRRQLAKSFNHIATGAVENWDNLSSAEKLNWCEHRQNLAILLCIYEDGAENFDELDPDLLIEFPEEDFI